MIGGISESGVLCARSRQYRVSESLWLTTCTEANCAWLEVSEGGWFREFQIYRHEAVELLKQYRSGGGVKTLENTIHLRPNEIREGVVI
jgi:hypothetical protein